jgi:hypothetical protein
MGRTIVLRLGLVAVGFLPVTLIAAATFDAWTLRQLALRLLLPAAAVTLLTVGGSATARHIALRGLAIGIVATFLYDLFRWSFLWLRWMETDPIVHIGSALGLSPDWLFGYLWRYIGNGGGMAVAFTALGIRGVWRGVGYGLFVCGGLFLVLLVSPHGQQMLFPLDPVTVVMALVGHVIYGATLGVLSPAAAGAGELPALALWPRSWPLRRAPWTLPTTPYAPPTPSVSSSRAL